VRSSFSDPERGTIDLIRAALPHCGHAAHVAVIDGRVLTISIMPLLPISRSFMLFQRRVDHRDSGSGNTAPQVNFN